MELRGLISCKAAGGLLAAGAEPGAANAGSSSAAMGQSPAPRGSQDPHFGDPNLPPGQRHGLCSGHSGRG